MSSEIITRKAEQSRNLVSPGCTHLSIGRVLCPTGDTDWSWINSCWSIFDRHERLDHWNGCRWCWDNFSCTIESPQKECVSG